VAEDGDQASFAGQQETYLWVVGADSVVEHVRLCWASLYTPQAIAYRTKLPPEDAVRATRISVGVQVMVLPEVSGVMFTASPKTGDRSKMAINASWGLGHAVVSGEVTPDEYWLSKIGPALVSTTVADKHVQYLPDDSGNGVAAIPVEDSRRNVPCLDESTILRLAALGQAVEDHYGVPQDIEWALERAVDGSEHIVVLQSRPVTSWIARQGQEKAKPSAGLASMMGMIRGAAQGSGS
jgi:pyruvate,water dikinase